MGVEKLGVDGFPMDHNGDVVSSSQGGQVSDGTAQPQKKSKSNNGPAKATAVDAGLEPPMEEGSSSSSSGNGLANGDGLVGGAKNLPRRRKRLVDQDVTPYLSGLTLPNMPCPTDDPMSLSSSMVTFNMGVAAGAAAAGGGGALKRKTLKLKNASVAFDNANVYGGEHQERYPQHPLQQSHHPFAYAPAMGLSLGMGGLSFSYNFLIF